MHCRVLLAQNRTGDTDITQLVRTVDADGETGADEVPAETLRRHHGLASTLVAQADQKKIRQSTCYFPPFPARRFYICRNATCMNMHYTYTIFPGGASPGICSGGTFWIRATHQQARW